MTTIMNFDKQDREYFVTLSAAKGLALLAARCFAALSMTVPVLVSKLHYGCHKSDLSTLSLCEQHSGENCDKSSPTIEKLR